MPQLIWRLVSSSHYIRGIDIRLLVLDLRDLPRGRGAIVLHASICLSMVGEYVSEILSEFHGSREHCWMQVLILRIKI